MSFNQYSYLVRDTHRFTTESYSKVYNRKANVKILQTNTLVSRSLSRIQIHFNRHSYIIASMVSGPIENYLKNSC